MAWHTQPSCAKFSWHNTAFLVEWKYIWANNKTIKADQPKSCHPNYGVYWKWQLCVYRAPQWCQLWKFCSNRESEWGTSNQGFNSLQYRTWMAIDRRRCLSSCQTWFPILVCSNSSCSTKFNSKCCAVPHVIYSWLLEQDLPMFTQTICQPMPGHLKKNTVWFVQNWWLGMNIRA